MVLSSATFYVWPVERMNPGDQLGQQHAEREDVGPVIDDVAGDLFRRHVGGRPHARAAIGQGPGAPAAERRFGARIGAHHFREAEVHHFQVPALRRHHIARLEVAVDDAQVVGGLEGLGNFTRSRWPRRAGPARGSAARAGFPPHELHHDDELPTGGPVAAPPPHLSDQ
jgi:hypothetical protein